MKAFFSCGPIYRFEMMAFSGASLFYLKFSHKSHEIWIITCVLRHAIPALALQANITFALNQRRWWYYSKHFVYQISAHCVIVTYCVQILFLHRNEERNRIRIHPKCKKTCVQRLYGFQQQNRNEFRWEKFQRRTATFSLLAQNFCNWNLILRFLLCYFGILFLVL